MVALVVLAICIFAAVRLQGTNLFIPAIINAAANLWGFGVLHNYRDDPETPRIPGGVHILSTLLGIIFLVLSFIVK